MPDLRHAAGTFVLVVKVSLFGLPAAAEAIIPFVGGAFGKDRPFVENLLVQAHGGMTPEKSGLDFTIEHFGIAHFDLNGDGIPELFVSYQHMYFCGTVGCQTSIFTKRHGEWVYLAGVSADEEGVFALDERIGGWRTLCAWEEGLRWGRNPRTGHEGYHSFCISGQCAHERGEDDEPENMPLYHRGNSGSLCKDSPVSKHFR